VDIILGLLIGLLVAGTGFLLLRGRLGTPPAPDVPLPVTPTVSMAEEVNQAVQAALGQAMAQMSVQARHDREESIKLASERVAQVGGQELTKRAEVFDTTMKSVHDSLTQRITQLDSELRQLRELNLEKFGNVDKAVSELAKRTSDLNSVLSSSQARGQWGERMAEDLLRAAGLVQGINYEKQDTIEGRGRPDYTFLLPPSRVLYMDVKFPLDAYAKYVEAVDDTARATQRGEFLKAVRDRVRELEKRDYVAKTNASSLDYVLLFVPNEGISGFIHEADPSLIDWALERQVVLCSPLSLYSFLVVVRQAADSFHTEETAEQMMQLVNKFKKQWDMYVKSLEKVKKNFDSLQEELTSLTVGTRFKGLHRETRRIDELRQSRNIPELAEVATSENDVIDIDEDFDDDGL
jgi:DNA recombination protein RmuC